tara:strand:- start:162 stop:2531 length:2370 start_codon:yes stop_codon:yes gene_type:complete
MKLRTAKDFNHSASQENGIASWEINYNVREIPDQQFQLALDHYDQGRCKRLSGNLDLALQHFKSAIKLAPRQPCIWLAYIETLFADDQLQNAIYACKISNKLSVHDKKLEKLTKYLEKIDSSNGLRTDAVYLSDLRAGSVEISELLKLGKRDGAIRRVKELVVVFPHMQTLYGLSGLMFGDKGLLKKGQQELLKAVKIKPDDKKIYVKLGKIQTLLESFEDALESYKKAVLLSPGDAEAICELGCRLGDVGFYYEGTRNFRRSLAACSYDPEIWEKIARFLSSIEVSYFDFNLEKLLVLALENRTLIRPSTLVPVALSLLKKNVIIRKALEAKSVLAVQESVHLICDTLANNSLFLRLMEVMTLYDPEFEVLLTRLRRLFLFNNDGLMAKTTYFPLQVALALNCHTNEFVFEETPEEIQLLLEMEQQLIENFSRVEEANVYNIACLASYRPLIRYTWANRIAEIESLSAVFKRHVSETELECYLARKIKKLSPIQDSISRQVRNQYEENPYPRWVNTGITTRPIDLLELKDHLRLDFSIGTAQSDGLLDILVAGTGTGQHPIETATRMRNCRVLGIDLSIASLGYTARKIAELKISNIELLHGDILDINCLGRSFDMIESVGVLHHMGDPLKGLRMLTNCLKPGGVMRLGFYSEVARRSVIEARKWLQGNDKSDWTSDFADIRRLIINSKNPHALYIKKYRDFYSTSEFRDLLFHVKEHNFTIPVLRELIATLDLQFSGFELDRGTRDAYCKIFPDDEALYRLDDWNDFEMSYPDTFRGMYQFWVQKQK